MKVHNGGDNTETNTQVGIQMEIYFTDSSVVVVVVVVVVLVKCIVVEIHRFHCDLFIDFADAIGFKLTVGCMINRGRKCFKIQKRGVIFLT